MNEYLQTDPLVWHDASLVRPSCSSWRSLLLIMRRGLPGEAGKSLPFVAVVHGAWLPLDGYTNGEYLVVRTASGSGEGRVTRELMGDEQVLAWAELPRVTLPKVPREVEVTWKST